jgi:hypothetical protein
MAGIAVAAALVGRHAAERGWVVLLGDLAGRVPKDRHVDFLTALWAHSASYAAGALGGIAAAAVAWVRRRAGAASVT